MRENDIVARLGGDEFGVMCESATLEGTTVIANRIRAALREPYAIEKIDLTIGVSVGVAMSPDALHARLLDAVDRAQAVEKAGRAK